jgi:hypothetical protein
MRVGRAVLHSNRPLRILIVLALTLGANDSENLNEVVEYQSIPLLR